MVLCKWHCSGVEPAVDNFRYTVHGLSTIRAGEGHGIDIWTMEFYFCCLWITSTLCQFCTASDTFLVSALTFPDVEWCSPITVTGDRPVLNVFQPVAETSAADGFRDPVYGVIVADQIILYGCFLDIPGFSCIVDQWCITAPAVWIIMFKLRCGK